MAAPRGAPDNSGMARRRGMVVAAAGAGLAVAVLLVLAVAMRERLLEAWYVWRLDAGDEAEKDRAAEGLAAMGSPRGAGHLYGKLRTKLEAKLRFGTEKIPLKNLVSILTVLTGLAINIDQSIDPSKVEVSRVMMVDRPALELLQVILKDTGLGYRLQGGGIILCPRGKTRDTFTTLPPVVDGSRTGA